MTERMRCNCGWEGESEELESVQVFAGNREEPPEYESKCPCCDVPFDELEYVPLCKECEDVYVQTDEDICGGCLEAKMEEALGFGTDALGG